MKPINLFCDEEELPPARPPTRARVQQPVSSQQEHLFQQLQLQHHHLQQQQQNLGLNHNHLHSSLSYHVLTRARFTANASTDRMLQKATSIMNFTRQESNNGFLFNNTSLSNPEHHHHHYRHHLASNGFNMFSMPLPTLPFHNEQDIIEPVTEIIRREAVSSACKDYIEQFHPTTITPDSRRSIANFMFELCETLQLESIETYPVALNFFDRYFSSATPASDFYTQQCISMVCVMVAAKAHESHNVLDGNYQCASPKSIPTHRPPSESPKRSLVEDICKATQHLVNRNILKGFERQLLSRLQWQLIPITPARLIPMLVASAMVTGPRPGPQTRASATPNMIYALETYARSLSLIICREYGSLQFRPSVVAFASIRRALMDLTNAHKLKILFDASSAQEVIVKLSRKTIVDVDHTEFLAGVERCSQYLPALDTRGNGRESAVLLSSALPSSSSPSSMLSSASSSCSSTSSTSSSTCAGIPPMSAGALSGANQSTPTALLLSPRSRKRPLETSDDNGSGSSSLPPPKSMCIALTASNLTTPVVTPAQSSTIELSATSIVVNSASSSSSSSANDASSVLLAAREKLLGNSIICPISSITSNATHLPTISSARACDSTLELTTAKDAPVSSSSASDATVANAAQFVAPITAKAKLPGKRTPQNVLDIAAAEFQLLVQEHPRERTAA